MRILVTNDDGIASKSLRALAHWAEKLGEVTVVAPKVEQSGKSQSIDFFHPVEIKRVEFDGIEAWAMDSTPADCVRFGVLGLEREYDLILSGINYGYNLGDDIAYSGTIGAIFEASRMGFKAIAFSTDKDGFDNAVAELDEVYSFIEEKELLKHTELLNVNIPTEKSKGTRITHQGRMFYSDSFVCCGNDMYKQVGEPVKGDPSNLTVDINAIRGGYVSISPLTANKTDLAAYDKLKNLYK
jgi:5'-nucleotidase